MTYMSLREASEFMNLMDNAVAAMIENGELVNRSVLTNRVMLDEGEVQRVAEQVHILEFYDEFDDELKTREQNLILGRDENGRRNDVDD